MDEPAASLDPKSRRSVINLLNSCPLEDRPSHDLDLISTSAPECLVIRDGAISADGPRRNLSDATLLAEKTTWNFLGPPGSARLERNVPMKRPRP